MALRTEASILGDVIVLRCIGRLVIREETTAFREEVKKLLSERVQVVLDLNEIEHAEAYNTAGNPEVLKILDKVLDGTPKVQVSDVITSTSHKAAAAVAA